MSRRSIVEGTVVGAIGAVWVAIVTWIGFILAGLPFPPFSLFDWEARVLPGGLLDATVGAAIGLVGALHLGPTAAAAKGVEHGLAVAQFIAVGALTGILTALLSRGRTVPSRSAGTVLGALLWVGFAAVGRSLGFAASPVTSLLWLAFVFVAWGWALGAWFSPRPAAGNAPSGPAAPPSRRRFLYWSGLAGLAAGAAILVAGTVRRLVAGGSAAVDATPVLGADATAILPTSGPAASPPRTALAARFPPAPGTRPEITPAAHFYRVDIDSSPPQLDTDAWRLEVGGRVARPLALTLGDLRAMPAITQAITLSCISNPVGGDLISTGFYTGVPFREIVALALPRPGATALNMRCADGYHESMALETAMDERTLLVYDLDGEPLPAEHGFPARVYIPGRYGMKQPKWLTSVELAEKPVPGFWVKRGWSRRALVRTTSVIDPPPPGETVSSAGTVLVGGIAYAGDRGLDRVEVQVDGGPWQAAQLRDPPLSPLTWVQWRFEARVAAGSHTFAVRAVDGDGRPQDAEVQDSFPAGATGIFSRTVDFARRAARCMPRRIVLGGRSRS
jgi:DMSO/TMAO reductase YedYZ molybdopterin-dependent catalytic subunit